MSLAVARPTTIDNADRSQDVRSQIRSEWSHVQRIDRVRNADRMQRRLASVLGLEQKG